MIISDTHYDIIRDKHIFYQSDGGDLYFVLGNGQENTLIISNAGDIPVNGMDIDLRKATIYWLDRNTKQIK